MENIICKQEKALKGKILTSIVLVFSFLFLFNETEPFLPRLILFVVTLLIFGFSVSFKISEDFKNKKLYNCFGVPFFAVDLDLVFPDYISVFSASFKLDNEWSTVSALGTSERHDRIVVRFFKDNKHYTVYKTKEYKKAVDKANELGEMLNVEVYDTIKELFHVEQKLFKNHFPGFIFSCKSTNKIENYRIVSFKYRTGDYFLFKSQITTVEAKYWLRRNFY